MPAKSRHEQAITDRLAEIQQQLSALKMQENSLLNEEASLTNILAEAGPNGKVMPR